MQEYTIQQINGGVCYSDLPYKLRDNQSQDQLNLWYNDKVLNKRWGQVAAATNLDGPVRAIYENAYNGYGILHAGTHLYQWDITNGITNSMTNAASNNRGSFFAYGDSLYYLDGIKYWGINSGFAAAEVTPYAPIVLIGCTPNLSASTPNEDYNLIGPGFAVWYTADGSNTYTLPGSGTLDETAITATINGTPKSEGVDFTADRTNRTITWGVAPSNGGVLNGVRITAYDTDATAENKIKNCLIAKPFGGESSSVSGGTRIFVSGNTNYPTTYWRSALKDPTYFPETEYDLLDNNDQAITAYGKQYGELIAFKTRSIYAIRYSFDGTNVRYPTRELNANIGCDMPGSVQLIDNRNVFFNTYKGGFMLDRTDQTDERNVKPISGNIDGTTINPGLLAEDFTDLQSCTSIDFQRKYYLNVGSKVYVWDYDISPYVDTGNYSESQRNLSWFPWDGIYVGAWFANNNTLYFGRNDEGTLVQTTNDFRDYGEAINAYLHSKAFDFNFPQYLKTVYDVIVGLRTDTNTAITIEYYDEKKEKIDSKTIIVGSFSYERFSYDVFTYSLNRYAEQVRRRPKRKKIVYFSIKLSNNIAGRDLGITNMTFVYELNRLIK